MEIITRPDETETKMVVISGGTLMKFLKRLAFGGNFHQGNDKVGWRQQVSPFRGGESKSISLSFGRVFRSRDFSSDDTEYHQPEYRANTPESSFRFFFCQSDRFGTVPVPSSLLCRQFFNNNSNNNRINFSRIFSVLSFINLLYRRSYLVGSVIITPIYTRVNSPVCEKLSSKSF